MSEAVGEEFDDRQKQSEITFEALIVHLDELARANAIKATECANQKAALRLLISYFDYVPQTSVDPTLTTAFEGTLRRFERMAVKPPFGSKKLAERSVAPYLSRLRSLSKTAVALVGEPESFVTVLERGIQTWLSAERGRKLSHVYLRTDMLQSHLRQWRMGSPPSPTQTNFQRAGRLETLLGLSPGSLRNKIPDKRDIGAVRGIAETEVRLARKDMRPHLGRVKYIPDEEVLPPLLREFYARLGEYKRAAYPGSTLDGKGLRRVRRAKPKFDGHKNEWSFRFERLMGGMIGWLTLPSDIEEARRFVVQNSVRRPFRPDEIELLAPIFVGAGLKIKDITPCHLVDPKWVGRFLDWKSNRTGESQFHQTFLMHSMALTKPVEGYLTQQPEFSWAYLGEKPIDVTGPEGRAAYRAAAVAWAETCSDWYARLREMNGDTNKHARVRDPRVELAAILNDPDPARHVVAIIRDHLRLKPQTTLDRGARSRTSLAIWWRDQFLLRLVASNPLRSKMLGEMTWRPDNDGNLYKTERGWRIRFNARDFKNEAGAARHAYDVPVSPTLTRVVDIYIDRARPVLAEGGGRSDAVFITQLGTQYAQSGVSHLVDKLCRSYRLQHLPGVRAIRCHAFRHIVATSWLKSHPGQYRAVASILHDTLETVLKNYDHSDPSQGLQQWDSWLSERMPASRATE